MPGRAKKLDELMRTMPARRYFQSQSDKGGCGIVEAIRTAYSRFSGFDLNPLLNKVRDGHHSKHSTRLFRWAEIPSARRSK